MAKFKYRALTVEGVEVDGEVEGATVTGVRIDLAGRRLQPVEIKPKRSILQFEIIKKKIPREEIMHLSRQLAAFIRSGVPVLQAIDIFHEETGNAALRNILAEIGESLRAGERFSDAVNEHRSAFPPFYVDMLQAAELTGALDTVLEQIARYIERDLEARRKVRAALAYPMIIMVMSGVTVVILSAFVLPRFKKLFLALNADLPLPTRMLLAVTDFVGAWWWALLAGFAVFGILLGWFIQTPRGREIKDRASLRLPIAGTVVRYAIIERFCRIFATMVQAGVALPDAIAVVGQGTNNIPYQRALARVREEMLQGDGLSDPIARTGMFPNTVTQMVRVGENTGTLDHQLGLAAEYFDQELDFKIKRMTTLFEPAVILFMGIIVGFVAIALISAMYGVFSTAGQTG